MRFVICSMIVAAALNAVAKDLDESLIDPAQPHPVCSDLKYASRDVEFYRHTLGSAYKNMAREAFPFALMSSNAYGAEQPVYPRFLVPGWERDESLDVSTWRGMHAQVYRKAESDRVAVAFEGTNSTRDWVFGNLLGSQYRDARALIDRIHAAYPDAALTTTGHSLGGGLAVHAALHFSASFGGESAVFAFDSSPRFFADADAPAGGTRITLLSENEDALAVLRAHWPRFEEMRDRGLVEFDGFDFLALEQNEGKRVSEHRIYELARGLTIVAASAGSSDADTVMNTYSSTPRLCRDDALAGT